MLCYAFDHSLSLYLPSETSVLENEKPVSVSLMGHFDLELEIGSLTKVEAMTPKRQYMKHFIRFISHPEA